MLMRSSDQEPDRRSSGADFRRLRKPLFMLFSILTMGVIGFMVIEDASFMDSLYMTVITLSTVGYGEAVPLSLHGKEFTVVLIMLGVSIGAYSVAAIAAMFVEGEVVQLFRRRQMKKNYDHLRDHIIVCGYGRLGKQIISELQRTKLSFIVIDQNRETLAMLHAQNVLFVSGNATEDEILEEAGVRHAKGLITALSGDADNLYVTLSAREMNPEMVIIARAEEESTESKLKKAGASHVVSPFRSGGRRMADILLRPHMVSFLETLAHNDALDLDFTQVPVKKWSGMVGKSLKDCQVREKTGAMIIGVKNAKDEIRMNPPADLILMDEDVLVVLGRREDIERLETL
jgi:voltage-gated potassium channel